MTTLIGFAALFAVHPPPIGPIGLVSLAAAAVLIERDRAREAKEVALTPPPDLAPVGTAV